MPDYGEILQFLANNPPELAAERQLHASMLELLAKCLREQEQPAQRPNDQPAEASDSLDENHRRWVHFS